MRHCRALSQSHRALGPVRLTVRAVPFSHGPARRNIGSGSGRGGFTRLVAGGICPAIGGGLHRNRPGAQTVTARLVPLAGPERNIAECPKDYEISAAVQTSFSWSNPAIGASALPDANTASSSIASLPAADGRRMRCCLRRGEAPVRMGRSDRHRRTGQGDRSWPFSPFARPKVIDVSGERPAEMACRARPPVASAANSSPARPPFCPGCKHPSGGPLHAPGAVRTTSKILQKRQPWNPASGGLET